MNTEVIIAEIDEEINKLERAREILAQMDASAIAIPTSKPRKRRKLSKDAKERIAAAQRKRWAAARRAVKTTPVNSPKSAAAPIEISSSRKRKLSAEARKRIAAAQRKRWAAIKAAKKNGKSSAAKKAPKRAPAKKVSLAKKAAMKKSAVVKVRKPVPEKIGTATNGDASS